MKNMRLRSVVWLLLPLLLTALLFGGCAKGTTKKPLTQTGQGAGKKIDVTGFYVEAEMGGGSYDSFVRYNRYIDIVSPLWYTVNGDGSIKDRTNSQVISFAHKNGIKVIPLVNVAKSNDAVLTDPSIRQKVIDQLITTVKRQNLDGLNIDFEFIPDGTKDYVKDKDLMTKFMSIIYKQMHGMGKQVVMSVIPHYQVSSDISGIYDYSKLAPYVDVVTLMLYDRHQAGSPPGPVSPYQWVEHNIKDAIREGFKPSQICLGVATYGYDWPAAQSGGFSSPTKDILAKAQQQGVTVKWSDTYREPYYTYQDPDTGAQREVWFESSATMRQKIALGKKYNVRGVCIWRLGFETPSFWTEISKYIGTRAK